MTQEAAKQKPDTMIADELAVLIRLRFGTTETNDLTVPHVPAVLAIFLLI
jgi:hypothetical protein